MKLHGMKQVSPNGQVSYLTHMKSDIEDIRRFAARITRESGNRYVWTVVARDSDTDEWEEV